MCSNNAVSRVAASRLKLSFSAFIVVTRRCLEVFPAGKGGCFHGAQCQNVRAVIEYILLNSSVDRYSKCFMSKLVKKPVTTSVFEEFDVCITPIFVCHPFPR